MTGAYRPLAPARLPGLLAEWLHRAPLTGPALRVAIDGPDCAGPESLGSSLVAPLRALGRPTTDIASRAFWRDASLRLERGRHDVESFANWLDAAALRREVLDPLGPGGTGGYLPQLRDPVTNRSSRAPRRRAEPGAIVIVSGQLLLGRGLPFDVTIHLAVSPAGRVRRTEAAQRWTLEAFERYDAQVRPLETADVVIRVEDPAHPAAKGLSP